MTKSIKTSYPRISALRWTRFNLRIVFVIITILGVLLGWFVHRVDCQKRAVSWIGLNGGTVYYDFETNEAGDFIQNAPRTVSKWLSKSLGIDFFANVSKVEFWDDSIDDVTSISVLTDIKYLNLAGTNVSDITPLAKLKKLKCLQIHDTKINDLTPLANLSNLEVLILSNTDVDVLTPLKHLKKLEVLVVSFDIEDEITE